MSTLLKYDSSYYRYRTYRSQLVKFIFGFGAKVVGYDAYPNNSLDFIEYKDTVEEAIVDIISLHVPTNKESFHLFDADMFSKVKKGAVLVNALVVQIDTPELIKG